MKKRMIAMIKSAQTAIPAAIQSKILIVMITFVSFSRELWLYSPLHRSSIVCGPFSNGTSRLRKCARSRIGSSRRARRR